MTDREPDMWERLAAPFAPEVVSWRVGSVNKTSKRGLALAYIDSRDVQDRLDVVCGPQNWQRRYSHADKKTICEIGIKVGDEWIWKADGAGDSDIEAEKGALSDAFKRAAVNFGVGRYLYNLASPWVQLTDDCKRITDAELERLQTMLRPNAPKRADANSPKAMALKGRLTTLIKSIRDCGDEDALADLITHSDVKEDRADAQRLMPDWSDRVEQVITETRAAFKGATTSNIRAPVRPAVDASGNTLSENPFDL